jgi:hypothetical protein
MLLGLVFLSPNALVLCGVCAEALVFGAVRKQAPMKWAFNVVSGALCTTLTVIVFRELLGSYSPVSIRGWTAAAGALLTLSVGSTVTVLVVKLAGQTPERRRGSNSLLRRC